MELAGLRNTAQQAHSMSSKVPLFLLIAKTVQQANTAQILPIQPTQLKPSPVHQESTAWVKPLHQKIVHQDSTVLKAQPHLSLARLVNTANHQTETHLKAIAVRVTCANTLQLTRALEIIPSVIANLNAKEEQSHPLRRLVHKVDIASEGHSVVLSARLVPIRMKLERNKPLIVRLVQLNTLANIGV
jgi:hypothetical protein